MSSILDALKKLEATESPPARPGAEADEKPGRVRRTAAGLLVAFVAGVGLAYWLASGAPSTPVPSPPPAEASAPRSAARPRAPEPPPSPAAESPRLAAAAPSQAAVPAERTEAAALPLAVPTPERPPSDFDPPRGRVGLASSEPPASVTPPARTANVASREPAEPPPARRPAATDEPPRPPAGTPRVQVSFLIYSPTPERRSVALSIDGSALVTLHEGESTDDIEVDRILPDRVHLRRAGQLFTVRTRD